MKIGDKLLKQLSKKYMPLGMINFRFGRYDAAIKTDEDGNAILLFIGEANVEGIIKGDRFVRVLIKDKNGNVVKDHWDHKGKA